VIALSGLFTRIRPMAERLDALTLRERVMIFGAIVTLVYFIWQALFMNPLAMRAKIAQAHLADVRRQIDVVDQAGIASSQDPVVLAALRNHALRARLAALDGEVNSVAQGYIAPERMPELLKAVLAEQRGLDLVSMKNLPVESLSRPAATPGDAPIAADDRGPFLHPVEMVVDGDYASVVGYLRALENLPWRIQWRTLDLTAGEYPHNRVRLVIGALSLSREWISV